MKDKTIKIEPDPVIEVYKKDVDMTLIDENFKLSVEAIKEAIQDARTDRGVAPGDTRSNQ